MFYDESFVRWKIYKNAKERVGDEKREREREKAQEISGEFTGNTKK